MKKGKIYKGKPDEKKVNRTKMFEKELGIVCDSNTTNTKKIEKTPKKKTPKKNKSVKQPKEKNIVVKKQKDKAGIAIVASSIVSLLLIMVVFGEFYLMDSGDGGVITRGATVNGIEVGGLQLDQAMEKVVSVYSEKAQNFELTINYENKSWKFTNEDFVVNSNIHTIVEEAITRGTNSSYNEQLDNYQAIVSDGKTTKIAFNFIFVGLDEKISEILEEVETPATNSEVIFNSRSSEKFTITDEKVGYKVDLDKLYNDINNQFLTTNAVNVTLSLVDDNPTITKEDNQAITHLRSSFSTNVADSTGARKSNVRTALAKIDGLKIQPGESVSFNYLTGPQTIENGYKVATIIYNGRFTDGVGGGICQASTTLYNALIRADIQIDEVNKHTLPVHYVPLALDAMVADYISDLQFTNNLDSAIFISAYCDSEKAYVDIYGGALDDEYTIETRSETVRTIEHGGDNIIVDANKEYTDKVLFKGEYYRLSYPTNGYEANSYKCYYKNGELIKEELIRHEIYQPQNGIIIEGSEVAPVGLEIITGDNIV